jgi:hypothetical protein
MTVETAIQAPEPTTVAAPPAVVDVQPAVAPAPPEAPAPGPSAEDELRASLETLKQQPVEEPPPQPTGTQAPGPKPPEPTKPAVEDDDLPDANPSRDNWAEMRARYKTLKAELAQVRATPPAALPAIEARVPTAPVPTAVRPPAAPGPELRPDFIFTTLAKVNAGELGPEYRAEAEQYIRDRLTARQVLEVRDMAKAGKFGDASQDIELLTNDWIPVMSAFELERRDRQVQEQQAQTVRAQAWGQVLKEFPAISERKGPEWDEFGRASQTLVQLFPEFWTRPDAPVVLAEIVKLRKNARTGEELSAKYAEAQKEISALKRRLGVVEAPQVPSAPPGARTKPTTPEDELSQELSALGIRRR